MRFRKNELKVHALASSAAPSHQGYLKSKCGRIIRGLEVSDIVRDVSCQRCKDILELEMFRALRMDIKGTYAANPLDLTSLAFITWKQWGF